MERSLVIFAFIAGFVFYASRAFAQDTIVQKNGKKIACKIINEDSTAVHFLIKKNNNDVETFLARSDISTINKAPRSYYKLDHLSFGVGSGLDYGGTGVNI